MENKLDICGMMGNTSCSSHVFHIARLYFMDAESPLKVLPKITYDHISLTPYSVIRVDLAAQILSSTMVSVLSHHGGNELSGTSKY